MFQKSLFCNVQDQEELSLPNKIAQKRMENFRKLHETIQVKSGVRINAVTHLLNYLRDLGFKESLDNEMNESAVYFIYTLSRPNDGQITFREALYSPTSHITFDVCLKQAIFNQMKTQPAPLFFILAYSVVPWHTPFVCVSPTTGLCPSCFATRSIERPICIHCDDRLQQQLPSAIHKLWLIRQMFARQTLCGHDEFLLTLDLCARLW